MKVVVGLGNPGKEYENTRHNVGFKAIDRLGDKHAIKVTKIKCKSLIGQGQICGEKVMLVKPQTYMNLSGEAVREILSYFKIAPEDLIVIYDDFDLDLGDIRLRKSGSSGTHNGMRSIVYQIQSQNFPRLRIGIGKSTKGDIKNFVVGQVSAEDGKILGEAVENSVLAVEEILLSGLDNAMNKFNSKRKKNNGNE